MTEPSLRDHRLPTAEAGPGGKWHPDGSPRHFPGNTFISMVSKGPFQHSLGLIHKDLAGDPLSELFALLPPPSHHVTLLDGTLAHSSTDQGIRGLTLEHADRLRRAGTRAPRTLTFAVQGISDITRADTQLFVLLEPDAESAQALLDFRRQVIGLLGLVAEPGSHVFHVSIAYRILEEREHEIPALAALRKRLGRHLPDSVTFDGCDFASFDDMTAFRPVLAL